MIRRIVRDGAETEDVFQDVVTEFLEAYDLGLAIEKVGAWLVRVARNKAIDRFRRRKTRAEDAAADPSEKSGADAAAADGGPESEAERVWLRAAIVDALRLLPDEQRDVFVMHELEGKSFEEIAARTGVGVNTLLSRKRYAVLFLRNHLQEVYDEYE